MGVGVATCSDQPIAAVKTGAQPGRSVARIGAMVPRFSAQAAAIQQQLAAAGQDYDNLRVRLRDPADTTHILRDTIVQVPKDDPNPNITIDFDNVTVLVDNQPFDAGMQFRRGDTPLFGGHVVVSSYKPGTTPPPPPELKIEYVGPGATAQRIAISPKSVTLNGLGGAQVFTVTAFGPNDAPIEAPPITYTVSDPSLATLSGNQVIGRGRRGTVSVTASFRAKENSPTITDAASVSFTLPASSISLVSGGGQSGKAGSALGSPAVVQVSAADGIGVPGVSVVFSAPAGGSVSPTTAQTDASGRASASMRLGSAVGPQGFAASTGSFSVAISATAIAGDASAIAIAGGNGQTDSVKKTLAPLSVKVTDSFGNPVSGTTVAWTRTSGGGTLGAPTSTSNTDGIATNSYTLGTAAGAEAVSASIGSASVSFSFTATAGGAATIAAVSGDGQTGRVKEPLANPFVVRVKDVGGNPVSNAAVTWTASNGSIAASSTTDASGQASAVLTLGTNLGAAGASAKIANGQTVAFSATVQPGIVSQLAFTANPVNTTANVVLSPVRVALRDAGGNATLAVNPVTIALGANSNGAVLSGTLTRNAVNGVATFDDLKVDRTGTGYTLVATSSNLAATSTAFSTTTGSAAGMTVFAGNGQSAKVGTAVTTAPAVKIVDAANNPIPGLSVTFTASGNGAVTPASGIVTTDALGIAQLTAWTLGTTAGSQTLTVTSAGLTDVVIGATATPGSAFRLLMTNKGAMQTSALSGATLAPQPALQLVDQFGNTVPAGSMTVAASVVGTGVTLTGNGPLSVGATTGAVAFTNLAVSGGGSVRIAFVETSGLIKGDTTNSITVGAGTATQLLLVPATPTTYTLEAGAAISSPQLKVADALGNPVSGVSVHFLIEKQTGPSTFASVATADYTSDASGLVTFTGRVPTAVGAYRVTATSGSIAGASVQLNLSIVAGAATHMAFQAPVSSPRVSATAGGTIPVTVVLLDQFENVATTSAATAITVALVPPSGAVLNGTTSVTTSSGVAVFPNLSINHAAIGYTLKASGGSFTDVTSPAFDITAAAASKVAFVPMPTTAMVSQTLSVNAQLQDQFGNVVPQGGVGITIAKASGEGTITGGSTTPTTNGNASFAIGFSTAGNYTLTASSTSLTSATTGNIVVSNATVDHIGIVGPTGTVRAKTNMPDLPGVPNAIRVAALAANGDTVTSASGTVTLTLSGGGASPGTLTGLGGSTVTATMSSGVATFSGLKISAPGTAYQITAAFSSLTAASAAFNVVGAPLITIVGSSSANVAAGGTFTSPTVKVTEADGTTPYSGQSVVWSTGASNGTFTLGAAHNLASVTVSPNATTGVAALDSWTAPSGVTSGSVTLTATLNGTTVAPVSFTMNISNSNLTVNSIELASLPSGSVANNATFSPTVQLKYDGSTNVPRAGVVVTATIVDPSGCGSCANLRPGQPGRIKPPGPAATEMPMFRTPTAVLVNSSNSTTVQATTDANGLATFSNIRVVGTLQNFALHFETSGLTTNHGATTGDIGLTAGAAQKIQLLSGDNQIGLIGAALPTGLFVQLIDTSTNVTTTGPAATVNFSTSNGSVTASAGTDVNGQATATWTLGASEGAQTMQASATIGGISSSVTFHATGSDIHGMGFTATPASSQTNGVALSPQPVIQLNDGNSAHPLKKSGVVITATIGSAGGALDFTPSLTGAVTATTDANGTATFTNLGALGPSGQAVRLTFSVTSGTSQTIAPLTRDITSSVGAAVTAENNSGTVVSAAVGSNLVSGRFPTVRVKDGAGVPIPNATGVTVSFAVNAGSCLVNGGTGPFSVSVDGSGQASLDGTTFSLPGAAGSCIIRATTTGVTTGTQLDFRVVARPTTGAYTWLGGLSDDFTHVSNWLDASGFAPSGAPTSSNSIFIPKNVPNSPKLAADASLASIKMEAGASFNLGGSSNKLTVYGDVDAGTVSAGGGINNGTLSLESSAANTSIKGPLPTTVVGASSCSGGSFVLGGTTTTGPVTLQCPLTIGANSLTTVSNGDFSTTGADGRLIMQTAGGLVDVAGNSTFAGGSEVGYLTNGTFEARGNFSQLSTVSGASYAPSGSHLTSLWGSSNQSVSFADPTNSFFWDAEVKNAGITATFTTQATAKNNFSISRSGASGTPQATFDQTFTVNGNLTANASTKLNQSGSGKRIIVAGAVTANASADLGGVDSLRVTGITFPVYNNTTAGKAPKLTDISGAAVLSASATVAGGLSIRGSLDFNGKALVVLDSFKVDNGTTTVSNAAGSLTVGGRFTEAGSTGTSFAPAAGFKVTLNGSSSQDVAFTHNGVTNSRFADLDVSNTSAGGVTFSTNGYVNGALVVKTNAVLQTSSGQSITSSGTVTSNSGSKLSGVAELVLKGSTFPSFGGNSTPAKTTVANAISMGADATLTGALSVQNTLTVSGHKLIVLGDLTVEGSSGLLRVANAADSVVVGGNADFKGADQDVSGAPITAGAFDFKGNFKASGTNTFFQGNSSANTTRFTGATTAQTIDISGSGNTFANVEITNTSATSSSSGGAVFSTDATVSKLMQLKAGAILTVNAGKTLNFSGSSASVLDIYSASKIHLAGAITPFNLGCRRHDPTILSLGSLPTLDGTNFTASFGGLLLNLACSAADLR